MLYIDDTSSVVKKAKTDHFNIVSKYLKRHENTDIGAFLFTKNNLERIINGKPDELIEVNDNFYDFIKGYSKDGFSKFISVKNIHPKKRTPSEKTINTRFTHLHEKIEKVINYEKWFITSAPSKPDYKLAENLNRNTCTYCNRIYTYTIQSEDEEKIMRPQFDHWFPKSKYPLLALSFYNLIPSCSICNSSVKSDADFNTLNHLHPYINNIVSEFSFDYEYVKNTMQYKVKITTKDSKIKRTLEAFKIEETYTSHQDELSDLIKTKKAYSDKYLEILKKSFPKANLSDEEIYRLAFGVEMNESKYHKKPLSKFKKDILEKLEII